MNRVIAKHLSDVLKAYSEGKIIEYRKKNKVICDWEVYKGQSIDENYYEYRIKPEPKYRPYANAEEFLRAQKEHGPYYIQIDVKEEAYYMLPGNVTDTSFITYNGCQCPYLEFVRSYEWQDGHPCGIMEE